jgi:serine/threonine protein phosphatase 1
VTLYAIGDIHGGAKTFLALLSRLNLKHIDRLYLLGDYVDRGNDSKGVLDTILRLLDSGYDVFPLRGNHDDMMLRSVTGQHDEFSEFWLSLWGNETLKCFAVKSIGHLQTRYISLLDALPYSGEDGRFIFVHAGLDLTLADPLTQTSQEHMLWGDETDIESTPYDGKTIVSGHTIRTISQIRKSLKSRRFRIDNGAFYQDESPRTGNLVAVNLDSMQLVIQPWLDGEVIE